MAQAPAPPGGDAVLPRLRPDLEAHPGPATLDGAPTTILHDPLRGRFFRLGWPEQEMLRRWSLGRAAVVAEALRRETPLALGEAEVRAFATFLQANQLVEMTGPGACRALAAAATKAEGPTALRWAQRLVVARLPLVVGDAWVRRHWGWLRWAIAPPTLAVLAILGLVGLWTLTTRWEAFVAGFDYLGTLEGVVLLGVMIAVSKVLHELGHAVVAVAAGARVSSMGVAFIAFWPILYTDVSQAWTLRSRPWRVAIALAGVGAEGALCILALAAWPLLPEGPLRSLCALFVTTLWLMTVLININPLMRFDGYYLLCDLMNLPNLQSRSLALLRHDLGRLLFGLRVPPPEALSSRAAALFRLYGVLLVIYRLVVYVTIALLVYHFVFKAAGIVLFALEIAVLILWPAVRTARLFWSQRATTSARRAWRAPLVLLVGGGLLIAPWPERIQLGAVIGPAREAHLFAEIAGRVTGVEATRGERVAEGAVLVRLDSAELAAARVDLERRLEAATWTLDNVTGLGLRADERLVAEERAASLRKELADLARSEAKQTIRAPFAGAVLWIDDGLRPGRMWPAETQVATLADPTSCRVIAYLPERVVTRLGPGARGRFLPDGLGRAPVAVTLTRIAATAAATVEPAVLASPHGGPVPARADPDSGRQIPAEGVFRAEMTAESCLPPPLVGRGRVLLDGPAESPLWRWGQAAWARLRVELSL